MSDAPERIWLQLGAGEYGSHTWCDQPQDWADENGEGEPEYVRADLLEAERARVKELEAALREASKETNTTEMALQHLAGRFVKASAYDAERARADRLEAALRDVVKMTDHRLNPALGEVELRCDLDFVRARARAALGDDTW